MNRKIFVLVMIIIVVLVLGFVFYLGWSFLNEPVTPTLAPISRVGGTSTEEIKTSLTKITPVENEAIYRRAIKVSNINPAGTQKAFLERGGDGIYLKLSDLKTNKTQKVGKVNLEDVLVVWHKPNEIFLIEKPTASLDTSAWSFNLKEKNLRRLTQPERGLMMNWFDNGTITLKFNNDQTLQKPSLSITNKDGETKNLSLFITLPNKCTFLKDKIYCAIPNEIPATIVLPDDYLKRRFYSQDKFVALSLNPFKVEVIYNQPNEKFDAIDLVFINNDLYFTNRYDNKVYRLALDN